MMWSRLDDTLLDHRKVFDAGDRLGPNGPVIAIGMVAIGLLWTNKQQSDGFLPTAVVKRFKHCDKPLAVAAALSEAGLWEEVEGGYRIHDFHDYNFTAAEVAARRKQDRLRKQKGGRNAPHASNGRGHKRR